MINEQENQLQILFEDNHIIVVLKQRNVPSQADNTGDKDMLTIVKEHIKVAEQKPGNVYAALVHRLDRPTGGIMVFAKTSKAAARLSEQLATNQIEKKYLAIVTGEVRQQFAQLTHYLVKDTKNNIVKAHTAMVADSKKAMLEYKLLEVKKAVSYETSEEEEAEESKGIDLSSLVKPHGAVTPLSLVDVTLITGRSHQIRSQFTAIGHPLYADHKYNKQSNIPGYGKPLALWAYHLRFVHPVKEEILHFKAFPPENETYWNSFNIEKYINVSKPN